MSPKKVLIIPHCRTGGGAGIYINDLLDKLSDSASISICGPYASQYAGSDVNIGIETGLVFPHYDGVRGIAKIYWALHLLSAAYKASRSYKENIRLLSEYDAIVLTSSIQLPMAALMKREGLDSKVTCLIQENLAAEGPISRLLTKTLLSASDRLITITPKCGAKAKRLGLSSEYLPNKFLRSKSESPSPLYDAAYLGGSSKLKGFRTLIEAFILIDRRRKLVIAMLGSYSKSDVHLINEINSRCVNGSRLVLVGQVSNATYYIARSKIVALPIRRPHFCRAAIEAGMLMKSFIVPSFSEVQDFGIAEGTCYTYPPGDIIAFSDTLCRALDNEHQLADRGKANFEFAEANFSSELWEKRVASSIKYILS